MLEAIIILKWTNFLNLENLYRRINKKMNTIYTKKMNEISRKFFKKGAKIWTSQSSTVEKWVQTRSKW